MRGKDEYELKCKHTFQLPQKLELSWILLKDVWSKVCVAQLVKKKESKIDKMKSFFQWQVSEKHGDASYIFLICL